MLPSLNSSTSPEFISTCSTVVSFATLHPLVGFPQVQWSGFEGDFYCLVMTILGPNLQQLHDFCENKWSLKTTLLVGMQVI